MAVYTVTTLVDESDQGATADNPGGTGLSLREALALAQAANFTDDVITFRADLSGGTLRLEQGEIFIHTPTLTRSLIIDGNVDDDPFPDITIDAGGESRVIAIAADPTRVGLVGAPVTLDGLVVTGGRARADAGIRVIGSDFTLLNSTVTSNTAELSGGGIGLNNTLFGPDITENAIINSTISENSVLDGQGARSGGGGGLTARRASIAVINSEISGNSVQNGRGGGILRWDARPLTLLNSTISGNSAAGSDIDGGGIGEEPNTVSSLTLEHSTVTGNIVTGENTEGGGIGAAGQRPHITLRNSVIAGNSAGGALDDIDGALGTSNGANIISETGVPGASAGDRQGVDPAAVFAQVARIGDTDVFGGVLADNGGLTRTVALNPLGPAVDVGADLRLVAPGPDRRLGNADDVPLTTDQRGLDFERAVNLPGLGIAAVDLGAFEVQSLPTPPTTFRVSTPRDENDPGATAQSPGGSGLSLREALTLANASPDPGVITFATLNGDIDLTLGELPITSSLTIEGERRIRLDGQGNSRVLRIDGAETGIGAVVALHGLTITGGRTAADGIEGAGGGLRVSNARLVLVDSIVTGNATAGLASPGGGIFAQASHLALQDSTLSFNSTTGADSPGGGLHGELGSQLTVSESTVQGNETTGPGSAGGGISARTGELVMTASTVRGNRTSGAESPGGGIHAAVGRPFAVSNSTVFGNSTAGPASPGGGILAGAETPLFLTSSTVTGNSVGASRGGGIALSAPGSTLANSLVIGNLAAEDGDDLVSEADISDQASLFGEVAGPQPSSPTGIMPEDVFFETTLLAVPGLPGTLLRAGLALDNGGPTDTVALQPGGRAIDAGDNAAAAGLTADQRGRGFPRLADGDAAGGAQVDIGAFELRAPPPSGSLFTEGADTRDLNEFDLAVITDSANALGGSDTVTLSETQRPIFGFHGGDGSDLIIGSSLPNIILGGAGADELRGEGGADLLIGGAGPDILIGGPQNDRFFFRATTGSAVTRDVIEDFEGIGAAPGDLIDLEEVDAVEGGGDDPFEFIGTDPFTARGQLRVFNQAGNTVIAGNTTGNLDADFEIVARDGDVTAAAWRRADFVV